MVNIYLTNQRDSEEAACTEAIENLICGYSSKNRENKHILVLNAYVDDSSAQTGGREFCLAGYMTTAYEWKRFSRAWDAVLAESPSIKAFHAAEAQSLKGEFLGWSEKSRDRKVYRLAQVVEAHILLSFDCRVSQRDFEQILLPVSPYDLRSPYFILFYAVMITAARQLHSLKIEVPIDFIFDEQGRVGAEAALWYGPTRALQAPHLRNLLGNRPIFRRDDDLIPLQAADCLAWHLRRSREEQFKHELRPALPLLCKDPHLQMEVSEQILRYWAAEFEKIVPHDDMQRRGASVVQPMKRFESHVMKKPREEQDAEYERFNRTMEDLLKVPPQVVKEAMEAEKRHREEEAQRTGKRGRGRPPKHPDSSSSDPASSGKD